MSTLMAEAEVAKRLNVSLAWRTRKRYLQVAGD